LAVSSRRSVARAEAFLYRAELAAAGMIFADSCYGHVAEWLPNGCKTVYLGSIPGVASNKIKDLYGLGN
jgi:hypothetical protein